MASHIMRSLLLACALLTASGSIASAYTSYTINSKCPFGTIYVSGKCIIKATSTRTFTGTTNDCRLLEGCKTTR